MKALNPWRHSAKNASNLRNTSFEAVLREIERGDPLKASVSTASAMRDLIGVLREITGKEYPYPREAREAWDRWLSLANAGAKPTGTGD